MKCVKFCILLPGELPRQVINDNPTIYVAVKCLTVGKFSYHKSFKFPLVRDYNSHKGSIVTAHTVENHTASF